jgi:hypothetical protein
MSALKNLAILDSSQMYGICLLNGKEMNKIISKFSMFSKKLSRVRDGAFASKRKV